MSALAVLPAFPTLLYAVLGALMGGLAAYVYRLLPAHWLCDYGEAPQAHHASHCRRLPAWGIAVMALLCALCAAGLAGASAYNVRYDTAILPQIVNESAPQDSAVRAAPQGVRGVALQHGSNAVQNSVAQSRAAPLGAFGDVPRAADAFAAQLVTFALALPAAFCAASLVAVLLLAALCDARYTILPDQLLLLAGALALGLWAAGGLRGVHSVWYSPFVGAAAGFLGLWAVLVLAGEIYKTEAMGFGDVKLLGVLGALCGPRALGVAVLLAVLAGGAIFGALLACGKISRRSMVAFGPFLVGGALAAVCLWPQWCALGAGYLALFGV